MRTKVCVAVRDQPRWSETRTTLLLLLLVVVCLPPPLSPFLHYYLSYIMLEPVKPALEEGYFCFEEKEVCS